MLRRTAFFSLFLLIAAVAFANAQYVGSAKSDKYHSESCQHAKRILDENRVEFKTVEEAQDAGYVACKVCKPSGKSKSSGTTSTTGTVTKTPSSGGGETMQSSGRCQATTKKGTQCKRNAAAGSRYCWQHGG